MTMPLFSGALAAVPAGQLTRTSPAGLQFPSQESSASIYGQIQQVLTYIQLPNSLEYRRRNSDTSAAKAASRDRGSTRKSNLSTLDRRAWLTSADSAND